MGFAQVVTQAAGGHGAGAHRNSAKNLRLQFVPQWLQQRHLVWLGQTFGMKLAVRKVAIHALVNAVKKLSVHPLKIKRQANRLPDTNVLKLRFAQVENVALKVTGVAVFKRALDQLARGELLARVLPRPVARDEFAHEVVFTRLKAFKTRGFVEVNLEGDAVEIKLPFSRGQVSGPVIRITHIGDVAAHFVAGQFVRARADGDVSDDFVERFATTPLVTEDGHTAHHQWQFRVRRCKVKAHQPFADHDHTFDFCVNRAELRRSQLADQLRVRMQHVSGQHGRAVMKFGFGIKAECGR